jgi:hypothetical protein
MVDFLAIAYVDEGVFGSSLVFASRAMRDDKESGKAPSQCYTMGKYKRKEINRISCAYLQKIINTTLRVLLDEINHALRVSSVYNESVIQE